MIYLIVVLSVVLILVVLFWIMPDKKGKSVAGSMKIMFGILPISKVCEALIAYFNSKKNRI